MWTVQFCHTTRKAEKEEEGFYLKLVLISIWLNYRCDNKLHSNVAWGKRNGYSSDIYLPEQMNDTRRCVPSHFTFLTGRQMMTIRWCRTGTSSVRLSVGASSSSLSDCFRVIAGFKWIWILYSFFDGDAEMVPSIHTADDKVRPRCESTLSQLL